MRDHFSFMSDVVYPLIIVAGIAAITAGIVMLLDMAFPEMSRRPEPQVQVVRNNGYVCVKVQGEKASTCTQEGPAK